MLSEFAGKSRRPAAFLDPEDLTTDSYLRWNTYRRKPAFELKSIYKELSRSVEAP